MNLKTRISGWFASVKASLSGLKVVWPILVILVIIASTYILFHPEKITKTDERRDSHENFPAELVNDKNTQIVEVNVFELISNGTITPKGIVLKPGHVLIGVIEGSAFIREKSGKYRPALPMSILEFEFANKGFAQITDLSQIVIDNDNLTISFRPGLENEKVYTGTIEDGKGMLGKIKIGIHYSPKPLQYGKAPEGFIKKGEATGPTAIAKINREDYYRRAGAFLNVGKRLEEGLKESGSVVDNIPSRKPSPALSAFCIELEEMEKDAYNGFTEWVARLYKQFIYGYQSNRNVTGKAIENIESSTVVPSPEANSSNLSGQTPGETVIEPAPLKY